MKSTLTEIKTILDQARKLADTYATEAEALLPKDQALIGTIKSGLDTVDSIVDALATV